VRFTREELKRLMLPFAVALALLGAGAAFIWSAGGVLRTAQGELAAAQAERRQNNERLARISEEEREVSEKIDVYNRLKNLNILGEERRLEWADAITRIRTQRELLDLRYSVERQRLLSSAPGKPGNVSEVELFVEQLDTCQDVLVLSAESTTAVSASEFQIDKKLESARLTKTVELTDSLSGNSFDVSPASFSARAASPQNAAC